MRSYLPSLMNAFDDDCSFVPSLFRDLSKSFRNAAYPAVNIKEDTDKYEIDVAAPGLAKDDFEIKVKNNVLTVKVAKQENKEEKDEKGKILRQEFSSEDFEESWQLPKNVEQNSIEAKMVDGVLNVTVPKKEHEEEKQEKLIEIK